MTSLARLVRRGQRPAREPPTARLGGAGSAPGALSTLEVEPVRGTAGDAGLPDGLSTEPMSHGPFSVDTSRVARVGLPDPYEADRFRVDLEEETPGPAMADVASRGHEETTRWRLLVRLVLVLALTLVAFHSSVGSAARSIAGGSVLVYLLAVPFYAALASAANGRRSGYTSASSFRARDVGVGAVLCLVAVGATSLLGPGLSGVYELWRVDLLMLWLFLLGAVVLTFGLHQAACSWPFWGVLLLLWPFPVRLANAALGGATGGALLLALVVMAVVAYGHRPEDPPRWQVLGVVAAVTGLVLALCNILDHPWRIGWPSLAGVGVAGFWWWADRTGMSPTESVVEHRPRGTPVVLLGLALVALVALPAAPRTSPPSAPTGITALSLGPLEVPGFVTTGTRTLATQQRFFGRNSSWQRVELRQGNAWTGPDTDGRQIVVDVLSTPRPQVLTLYPVVTTYPMGTLSSIPDAEVDLGHGVVGQLYRANDARHGVGYTLLTFSWRLPVDMAITGRYTGPPAQLTQRITLVALDDHGVGAPFPQPGNATLDGLRAAFVRKADPRQTRPGHEPRADDQLLGETARRLVDQRLTEG